MPAKKTRSRKKNNQSRQRPLRIGLTGGIASGKSAVADMFAELGAPVIDTDVIARDVVAPGQPALDDIRQHFGDSVINDLGQLDRAAMRRIVFADDDKRHALESILHPRIRYETQRQSAESDGDYQIIVVPLLVESPMKAAMDRILVVDVPEAVQLQRLLARDAESTQQAQAMIDAQAGRGERLELADDIVDNRGSLDQTREQVEKLHRKYLRLSKAPRS